MWLGRRMSLILDHINGVANDHRLENLRIVCPNCAATLDTHCGRQNRLERKQRVCARCGVEFWPRHRSRRYCSRYCGIRYRRDRHARPERRKAVRPSHEQLVSDIAAFGYVGAGRRYGVSDNAIRKWLSGYEQDVGVATHPGNPSALE